MLSAVVVLCPALWRSLPFRAPWFHGGDLLPCCRGGGYRTVQPAPSQRERGNALQVEPKMAGLTQELGGKGGGRIRGAREHTRDTVSPVVMLTASPMATVPPSGENLGAKAVRRLQSDPPKPGGHAHTQLNPTAAGLHVPPFWHGRVWHTSWTMANRPNS